MSIVPNPFNLPEIEADALISKLEKIRPGREFSPQDVMRALEGMRSLFDLVGEDSTREGLQDSPSRIIKAFVEVTSGLDENPREMLNKSFGMENAYEYDQIILSRDIPFASLCEHHWLPFTGVAHVAYIPNPNNPRVVGLSKLARVVDAYAKRPQVQEKMTAQIAKDLQDVLDPIGVAVIIKGKHTCQCLRGIKKDGSMVTSSLHGAFKKEIETREELYRMIALN